MDVVVGFGPLATSVARALGQAGRPTVLGSPKPRSGPFLWRRVDAETGEGMRGLAKEVRRLFVVQDGPPRSAWGVAVGLADAPLTARVYAVPLDQEVPDGLTPPSAWSGVAFGTLWGPDEPLVARWSDAIAEGRHVLLADPGPMFPVPMADASAAVIAAADHPGARWTVSGQTEARLPQLAEALSRHHRRPLRVTRATLGLCARHAGVDAARIKAWVGARRAPVTPGWALPEADPARWTIS